MLAQGKTEVGEIVLAPQFGLAYLPLHVIKNQKLLEKHLAKNGLPNTKVNWGQTTGGAAPAAGGDKRPVLWSSTSERLPDAAAQTDGRPQAIASNVTFPNVSVMLGLKKISALA